MKKRGTKTYNVHEAKTHLSRLLDRALAGEEVVIAKSGVPVARLVPVVMPAEQRPLGVEADRVFIADDFDAPLPPDVMDEFET
jgi:prevent-host-death family protein